MLVFCLILALGSWVFTSLNETFKTHHEYRLSYPKTPEDKIPATNLPIALTAELQGSGWNLFQYTRSTSAKILKINLSIVEDNLITESYIKDLLYDQLPENIAVSKVMPKEINVKFERKYTKKVPVILKRELTFKEGYYQKEAITLIPDSVTITGTKRVIDSITNCYTDTLRLTELAKPLKKTVEIIKPDNVFLEGDDFLIDVELNIVQHTEKKMEIPVSLINASETNFMIIPKAIELKCLVPVDEYDEIIPDAFTIEADYLKNAHNGTIDLMVVKRHAFAKQLSFYPTEVDYIKFEDQ